MNIYKKTLTTLTIILLILTLTWSIHTFQNNENFQRKNPQNKLNNQPIYWATLSIGLQGDVSDVLLKVENLVKDYGGRIRKTIEFGQPSAAILDIPRVMVTEFSRKARTHDFIRYVEPNLQFQATFIPNDPNWTNQWGPTKIQADYAWNTTMGSQQILVSVVDTGIDYNHTDLSPNYNASGYNWVENNTDPMDPSSGAAEGHGTFCAGIIAAKTNNSIGIAGLAQVQIMAERVSFYIDECAEAIKHSVDQGANIINLSWGDYFDSKLIHDAIKYAHENDVLVIAGAGNDDTADPFYPAAYNEVISVSGTDSSDSKASFSNHGDWIEIAAPAVNISSTALNNTYQYWGGTSFAGPHVVGVAALTWSQFPNLTRDQVRVQLRYTIDDLGSSGFDSTFGYGRVNAKKAVETALPNNDLTILFWDPPETTVTPNDTVTVTAAIHNFGLNDAYNVSSKLLANGIVVSNVTLSSLTSGETAIANYSWTPTQEGNYNLTCSLPIITGETISIDNMRQTEVQVWNPKTIKVPSDYSTITLALAAAHDGDIIQVSTGVYNESISIEKSIKLIGSGSNVTTIRGQGGAVVTLKVPFTTVSGFTVFNGSVGVKLERTAQNSTISNNLIMNCSSDGIEIDWGFGILIFNNARARAFCSSSVNPKSSISTRGIVTPFKL